MDRRLLTLTGALLLLPLAACDIDQTREGEMPDIEVEEGQAPAYDVEGPEVEVGEDRDTIVVDHPTVDVDVPEDSADVDDTTGTGG